MNIGIFGAGAWGLGLGSVLLNNGNKVLYFEKNPAKVHYFLKNRKVEGFEDFGVTDNVSMTDNLQDFFDFAYTIVIAVPCKALSEVVENINQYLNKEVLIINAAKGFEPSTNSFVLDFLKKEFKGNKYVKQLGSILGPGFAIEVLKKKITCVCAVSKNIFVAKYIQKLFSNSYFRVYALTDVAGAQIGASLKNAIAIGSGIIKGLGYGENTKAALISRGIAEIKRFGKKFHAKPATFMGLTGMGDLVLTCNSDESRNFKAGYIIGKDDSAKNFLETNTMTVEGISTINVAYQLAKKYKIYMPIIEALYQIIFEEKKPSIAIKECINRPLKKEE